MEWAYFFAAWDARKLDTSMVLVKDEIKPLSA